MLEKNLKDVLEKYLSIRVSLDEVITAFGGRINFGKESYGYKLSFNPPIKVEDNDIIRVYPSDFKIVLNKYLKGSINDTQLNEWAFIIIGMDFYEIAQDLPEYQEEILLEILHLLATPSIFDGINKKIVWHYLECIERWKMP